MRLILPLPLRRFLLGRLLFSVTMATAASGAEFVVDAAQATNPGQHVYNTLQELADSGALSSGDTVILHNDDSSLTSGLPVTVNFQSNDPDIFRTIDLAGLRTARGLYNDYAQPSRGEKLKLNSIILSNSRSRIIKPIHYSSQIGLDSISFGDGVRFVGNGFSSIDYCSGGVIDSFQEGTSYIFGDDVAFIGNYIVSSAGYASAAAVSISGNPFVFGDRAVFADNYASSDSGDGWGGAIASNHGASFTMGTGAVFTGNYASSNSGGSYGGAIFHQDMEFILGDGAVFTNNRVGSGYGEVFGGAIYMEGRLPTLTIGSGAVFSGNYARSGAGKALGGAIYYEGMLYGSNNMLPLTIGSGAVFTNNHANSDSSDSHGGAIFVQGSCSKLTFRDGATFMNNYATTSGGAIHVSSSAALSLHALTKDVLFSGNMTKGYLTLNFEPDSLPFTVENGIANAIHINDGNTVLTLAAAQGREIRFNDPITSDTLSDARETFTLNRYTDDEGNIQDSDGTIVFSGELYQGEEAHLIASRYNNFVADTTLYGGTLLLEHGAVFGRNLEDMRNLGNDYSSLTVEKGTLEIIGGSTANANAFSLSGRDAVLRPGDSAFINANTADFSRGFTFDMRHQLQSGPGFGPGLTLSAAQSFTAGGLIGVADTGSNASFFYADRSWKQDRVFHVLTDAEHTLQGNFDGVISQATGTDRVDSPYSYTGTWSHRWTDADGDGYAEQLQLVWKADGTPISSIDPELAGELAFNSLWSSASNAAALGGNVLSRLNAFRLADKHARDLWGMGLGDFARQRSRGGADGYDYSGGGYSVGADSGFGHDNGIWGIAFGQLYGHAKSRDFQGRNTQDTRMGSLYWGRLLEESRRARWTFKGSLTWAETHNKMNSRLGGAPASTAKWNNETWLAQAEVSRTADYAGGWRLTPFLRVEFTHGTQDAFREQGGYGRDFGGTALKRLSIPVGLEIGRTDEWKGRPWTQALRVSYVGDVLQDVPEGTVYSPFSDMSWRGRAVSPERHGFRAEYNTSLQCNERWSVYGGYSLEARGNSLYHRVNAGVARSF